MRKVYSAGGVVVNNGEILMLRKTNGDWVLPKGRIELNETIEEAAVREVEEETGILAEIIEHIGEINYQYCNIWYDNEMIDKFVTWFVMRAKNGILTPLRDEGFVEAKYIPIGIFEQVAKYEDERRMIRKALEYIGKR